MPTSWSTWCVAAAAAPLAAPAPRSRERSPPRDPWFARVRLQALAQEALGRGGEALKLAARAAAVSRDKLLARVDKVRRPRVAPAACAPERRYLNSLRDGSSPWGLRAVRLITNPAERSAANACRSAGVATCSSRMRQGAGRMCMCRCRQPL